MLKSNFNKILAARRLGALNAEETAGVGEGGGVRRWLRYTPIGYFGL